MLTSQNREICKLANNIIIKDLNASIISLTETITSLQSSVNTTSTTQQTASEQLITNTTNNPPEARVQPANLSNVKARPTDRNLNVVIYGIDECPPRTPRANRSKLELEKSSLFLQLLTPAYVTLQSMIFTDWVNFLALITIQDHY